MRLEPWINHAIMTELLRQKCRDASTVFVVARHSEMKRLRATQCEPRVERTRHRARCVLNEIDAIGEVVVAHDRNPADHVAMAVEIFRRRMIDDVRAVLERFLEERRGECVVDYE